MAVDLQVLELFSHKENSGKQAAENLWWWELVWEFDTQAAHGFPRGRRMPYSVLLTQFQGWSGLFVSIFAFFKNKNVAM